MALVSVTTPAPHVRTITLDNPSRLNSMSFALVADLYEAIAEVAADNDCRVVVLTGAGRAFCSGLELEHAGLPAGHRGPGPPPDGPAGHGVHGRHRAGPARHAPAGHRRRQRAPPTAAACA